MGNYRNEGVHIGKNQFVVHVFFFFLEAAQVTLLPFLTLFFRYVGLTAAQTGLVCGLKALTWMIFAPLWTKAAGHCQMKKAVLLLTIFFYATTYLVLPILCRMRLNLRSNNNNTYNVSDVDFIMTPPPTVRLSTITLIPEMVPTPITNNVQRISTTNEQILTTNSKQNIAAATFQAMFSATVSRMPSVGTTTSVPSSLSRSTIVSSLSSTTTATRLNGDSSGSSDVDNKNSIDVPQETQADSSSMTTGLPLTTGSDESNSDTSKVKNIKQQIMDYYDLTENDLSQLSVDDLRVLIQNMVDKNSNSEERTLEGFNSYDSRKSRSYLAGTHQAGWNSREKRFLSDNTTKYITTIWKKVEHTADGHIFLVIMAVIIVGELLSSPLFMLADNLWFWFLEGVDATEKYSGLSIIRLFAGFLFPLGVAATIHFTKPTVFGIDHFMLHFFSFGAFLFLLFLMAVCLPSTANTKIKKKKRLTYKAICILFRDRYHIVLLVNVFLLGGLSASVSNFLFWVVDNKGGTELDFGLTICITYLTGIPILLLRKYLIKKITPVGLISVAIFVFAVQSLYYSFLWISWAVLPIQVLSGFFYTGLWLGLSSIPSFQTTSPALDREVQLVLRNVYYGLGFCVGSLASGWIADTFDLSILYQCVSVLSLLWGIIFVLVFRCRKTGDRSTIRYSKLNLVGDDEDCSDTGFDDDDWLEVALKDEI